MFFYKTRKQVRQASKDLGKPIVDNGADAGKQRWAINFL